jgi:SHS2 domain-containing protein
MPYEILPHPADVRLRATGPTLEAAFEDVVLAFAELSETPASDAQRHEISVESEDGEALLFDFLAELILLQEVEECGVSRADGVTVDERPGGGYVLGADVLGGPIEEALFDIKSPTYSRMIVEERDGEWLLEVTLDV